MKANILDQKSNLQSIPQGETHMLNRKMLAATIFAAFVIPAIAADAPKRALDLGQAIELINQTYPGRAIAAQADPTGGDGAHYHVDMLLSNGRVAKFDVDARSHRIYNRVPPESGTDVPVSLGDAVKKVQSQTKGRVVSAEFDPDPRAHYHMNVRGPKGQLSRLDFDLETGKIARHLPRS